MPAATLRHHDNGVDVGSGHARRDLRDQHVCAAPRHRDAIDLTDMIGAAMTCTPGREHVEYLIERGAHYVFTVKGQQRYTVKPTVEGARSISRRCLGASPRH
ncbi:MAG: hypothetical protein J2P17_01945 [Mycobacterium sp.]|nr:hypothetical protein [Mycobacterium sp.]